MRCPDCNKFVSFDEPEIEGDTSDVVGTAVSGNVRIVLKCADCGGELKDAELDYEVEIVHDCKKCKKKQEPEFTADDAPDFSSTSRRETTMKVKKKGVYVDRPIPFRYQKQYYGAEITGHVTCSVCEESIEYTAEVEERASGFNELV
jgi:hypothetical protein